MSNENLSCKKLQQVVYDEMYRTDTSTLLAFDNESKQYLFRALNSNYFLQDDDAEVIKVLEPEVAEEIWNNMPDKHVVNVAAAFPQQHGGIGMDTYTNIYDD